MTKLERIKYLENRINSIRELNPFGCGAMEREECEDELEECELELEDLLNSDITCY
jgi:hypothetical protein